MSAHAERAPHRLVRGPLWERWQAVLLTRIEPGGSVILIQTRWHDDDLAGRILADEADRWTVINLPALALSEDDALGRPVGAALWPQRYDEAALAEIRRSVDERVGWSLYMQQPRPQEGGVWQWSWITDHRVKTRLPAPCAPRNDFPGSWPCRPSTARDSGPSRSLSSTSRAVFTPSGPGPSLNSRWSRGSPEWTVRTGWMLPYTG